MTPPVWSKISPFGRSGRSLRGCGVMAVTVGDGSVTAWSPVLVHESFTRRMHRPLACPVPTPERTGQYDRFAERRARAWGVGGWLQLECRDRAPAGRGLHRHPAAV